MRQRSMKVNMKFIGMIFAILGAVFIPVGFIGPLIFQPGRMVTINGAYRPLTEADAWIGWLFGGIFWTIGVIFLMVGLVFLVRPAKRRREIERLKREGVRIEATVQSCEPSNIRLGVTTGGIGDHGGMGGRATYHLTCSYEDFHGTTYVFKSDLLREDPTPYLQDGKVVVYHDRGGMNPNYVDVDESIGLGSRVMMV